MPPELILLNMPQCSTKALKFQNKLQLPQLEIEFRLRSRRGAPEKLRQLKNSISNMARPVCFVQPPEPCRNFSSVILDHFACGESPIVMHAVNLSHETLMDHDIAAVLRLQANSRSSNPLSYYYPMGQQLKIVLQSTTAPKANVSFQLTRSLGSTPYSSVVCCLPEARPDYKAGTL